MTLQAGTYVIGSELLISSNVTLDLNGATLQAAIGLDDNIIRNSDPLNGDTNITIKNGTIDGNRSNQTQVNPAHGIALYNAHSVTIENVTIHNTELDGVYIGGSSTIDGISIGDICTDVYVLNCTIYDTYRNWISLVRGTRLIVDNLTAYNNNLGVDEAPEYYKAGGIDLESNIDSPTSYVEIMNSNLTASRAPAIIAQSIDGLRDYISVHDNVIETAGTFGVAIYNEASNISIYDNTITVTGSSAIWLHGQTYIITNVTVEDNTLSGDDTNGEAGVHFRYVHGGVADRNIINDFHYGLLALDGSDIASSGNTIHSCANPVYTDGTSTITQSGNTIN